jgi:hypothetical protein
VDSLSEFYNVGRPAPTLKHAGLAHRNLNLAQENSAPSPRRRSNTGPRSSSATPVNRCHSVRPSSGRAAWRSPLSKTATAPRNSSVRRVGRAPLTGQLKSYESWRESVKSRGLEAEPPSRIPSFSDYSCGTVYVVSARETRSPNMIANRWSAEASRSPLWVSVWWVPSAVSVVVALATLEYPLRLAAPSDVF